MAVLSADIERDNNRAVAIFSSKEITTPQMQDIMAELMEIMRNDNVQYFVLDMSVVEFISSGCLGSLVEFSQDLTHIRGKIALANCRDNVAFLFKVTRLDVIFPIYDDAEEAMDALVNP